MKVEELLIQTEERIRELDKEIDKARLKDKKIISTLEQTRRSNYLLYKALSGKIYPHMEEKLQ